MSMIISHAVIKYLFLFETLECLLVTTFFGHSEGLGDVSGPLHLTGCYAHLPQHIHTTPDHLLSHQTTSYYTRPPLGVLKQTYINYGDRRFAAVGPKLWNSLPADPQQADIVFQQFKWLLKTFLFRC